MSTIPRQSWNLRVSPEDQGLIERAVSASGLTRTDFVLQIPRAGPFEGFRRLLDAPPNPSAPQEHHGLSYPLAAHHGTADFDCGDDSLNHWLQRRALSHQRSGAPCPIRSR